MPATATDRLYGLTTSIAVKGPCRVATTAAITLSGLQTVDGEVLAADDRVLVKDQTDASENGIYVVNTSAWSRAPDFNGTRDAVNGTLVIVRAGSVSGGTVWELTTEDPVVIGTDDLTFEEALLTSTATATFRQSGTQTIDRTGQNKMREEVTFEDFENDDGTAVAGNGTRDDTTGIQAAIDSAAATGRTLRGKAGTYRITAPLLTPSNLKMVLDPACRMLKDYVGSQTPGTAMVHQATYTSKISNVWIEGGSWGHDNAANIGKMFCLHGDDVTLKDITVDGFAGGQAFVLSGDRMRVLNPKCLNSGEDMGDGGIRYVGGDDFICSDAYVDCGDDCFQLVPIAPGSANADLSITNAWYVNCRGLSHSARVIVAGLVDQDVAGGMTANILDSGFIGITGKGGNRFAVITNEDSSGAIGGITLQNVRGDMSGVTTAANQEIIITRSLGTVRDIALNDVHIRNIAKIALDISGSVQRVRVNGGFYDKPTTSGLASIFVDSADDVEFGGATCAGATNNSAVLVGSGGAVSNFKWHGGQVYGIEDNFFGINGTNVAGFTVDDGALFKEATGHVAARGIRIGATSSKARIVGVDLSNLTVTEAIRMAFSDGCSDVQVTGCIGYSTNSFNTSAAGNVGGGTDNLITRTIQTAQFRACKALRIVAWGTTANNANAKTVAALFGSTTLVSRALTVSQTGAWRIDALITNDGTDSQTFVASLRESAEGGGGTAQIVEDQGTATENDGSTITIKCTGTATADNDIVQEGMVVEFIN